MKNNNFQIIIFILVLLYSVLSPLFKNKKKQSPEYPPGERASSEPEEVPEYESYKENEVLLEIEKIFRGEAGTNPVPEQPTYDRPEPVRNPKMIEPTPSTNERAVYKEVVTDEAKEFSHQENVASVFSYTQQAEDEEAARLAPSTGSVSYKFRNIINDKSRIKEAFVFSEILSKPIALRRH